MKITRDKLAEIIKEELQWATPAEVVTNDDVATPEGVAEHIQKLYSMIANLQSELHDLRGGSDDITLYNGEAKLARKEQR